MFFLLIAATPASAAEVTLPGTEARVMPHSANGRDYTLHVALPDSYASQPTRRYPVIYCNDGYWDFPVLRAEIGNLVYDQAMPECILVGIAYSGTSPDVGALRQIDLTPGVDTYNGYNTANSGGADAFLNVIANQFIPFIESQYRADPAFRVLTGHSFGGLFTSYALFQRPGLFQACIVGSPSLWYRQGYVLNLETAYAATHRSLSLRLFVGYATEESVYITGTAQQLVRQIRASNYSDLAMAVRAIDGERHAGDKGELYNRGLRFVFAPFAPVAPSVTNPGFDSRPTLINVSTRGVVGSAGHELIAGVVISGLVPKHLLVRAAGPALTSLGVADVLSDPQVAVMSGKQQLAFNDNWGDAPDQNGLRNAILQSGAFSFPVGSRDAALLVTLDPGSYTFVVSGVNGAQGNALVEAYEIFP